MITEETNNVLIAVWMIGVLTILISGLVVSVIQMIWKSRKVAQWRTRRAFKKEQS